MSAGARRQSVCLAVSVAHSFSVNPRALGRGMRYAFVLCLLIPLLGCNTAGPHFRGIPATRITVDGSEFDVRVTDTLAEAIRINVEYAPRFAPIRHRAALAIAAVSGCTVSDVLGDQALATGRLDCSNRQAPRKDTAHCTVVTGPSRNQRVPDRVGAVCERS